MKLEKFVASTSTFGESEDIEIGIDKESEGLIMRAFADNIYSDKIGSVVREIASNCVDAHQEVNQTKPFEIEFRDDHNKSIIFRDFGPGLSPDRIKRVFSKYFSSTKRDSNGQIGGFGIGSKSPYAYTDIFHIRTRVDNVEYLYEMRRGTSYPVISKIAEIIVPGFNFTEVIIPISTHYDVSKFEDAIHKQLAFFHNMRCMGIAENMNDRKIVEGKLWVQSNMTDYISPRLIIGDVPYPIPANLKHGYSGSFGVKFDIGEIPVTMSRESIDNKPWVEKLIEERVNEVYLILKSKYFEKYADAVLPYDEFRQLHYMRNMPDYSLVLENVTIKFKSSGVKSNPGFNSIVLEGTSITMADILSMPTITDIFASNFIIDRYGHRTKPKYEKLSDSGAINQVFYVQGTGFSKYIDYHIAKLHSYPVIVASKRWYMSTWQSRFKAELDKKPIEIERQVRELKRAFFNRYKDRIAFYDKVQISPELKKEYQEILKNSSTKVRLGTAQVTYRSLNRGTLGQLQTLQIKDWKHWHIYYCAEDRRTAQEFISSHAINTNYKGDTNMVFKFTKKRMTVNFCQVSKPVFKKLEKYGGAVSFDIFQRKFEKLQSKEITAVRKFKPLDFPKSLLIGLELNQNTVYSSDNKKKFIDSQKLLAFRKALEMNYALAEYAVESIPNHELTKELEELYKPILTRVRTKVLIEYHKIYNQIKKDEKQDIFQSLREHTFSNY